MSDYKFSIEAIKVNKTYKKKDKKIDALNNFNINIKKGSIYGLLGPNGAGKSTFINMLGGLVLKTSGSIKICGVDIDKNSKLSRTKIGIVPQELNIDPFFTPIELLELQGGLYGVAKKNRKSEEILFNLGLDEQKNSYARTLSGGMRRRLLIAKALVHNPDVLILDEPTAGVDVELRKNLWHYIRKLNKDGMTICLTTHYLEEAQELCDYITILNKGKIIKSDTKINLLNLVGKKTVRFILDKDYPIPNKLEVYEASMKNNILTLSYEKNKVDLKIIINILNENNIIFKEIDTYENDLEDIFIDLIKNK
ncbi:ABC transporter ATP-binding protein [Alphaproteobacteria bacterium]|nr:ABC transporter ATP-binding protein [Alphaproteobacteria bacterium]